MVRRFYGVLVALLLLAGISKAAQAQGSDPLDAPLAATRCGGDEPGTVHFTLAATGDTFPHENIQAVGEARGYDYLFDHVRPFLQAADLAYTNFDGAMLETSPRSGYPAFNYNPQLATALKNTGIGVVSTANNHILDRGPEGLDATLQVLEQAGIAQHGTVPSTVASQPRPAYLPLTLTRDGVSLRIGFLSFTWGTNGLSDPYGQVNLLYQQSDYGTQGGVRPEVLAAIAQAKRETDLVVVATHWGIEYQFYPQPSQIEAAHQLAAAGADLILGAQPHTLQPVDLIDTDGRKTLVFYSLANFLASQGPLQAQFFSATSIIAYIGLARSPNGTVHVTGYRYLPTIHVDFDTRPAPLPPQGYDDVLRQVRLKLRDPHGQLQVSHDPALLGTRVEVCPTLSFAETPGLQIGGDFAHHYLTRGDGIAPRPLDEAIAVFGYPIGPVVQELTGDCSRTTSVLYTERQRLELNDEANWPTRVVGTHVGVEVFRRRYRIAEVQRATNLPEAIAGEAFQQFYQSYGGLATFGYPISAAFEETDALSGQPITVQYFERARFELAPASEQQTDLLYQVRLGALGREYPGIEARCAPPPVLTQPVAPKDTRTLTLPPPIIAPPAKANLPPPMIVQPAAVPQEPSTNGWLLLPLLPLTLLGLSIAAWYWQRRKTLPNDPDTLLAELLRKPPNE